MVVRGGEPISPPPFYGKIFGWGKTNLDSRLRMSGMTEKKWEVA